MKEYRIVKRYKRWGEARVYSYYIIQYFSTCWVKTILYLWMLWKQKCWKSYKELEYHHWGIHSTTKTFENLKLAKEFMKNLKTPVFAEEVIVSK